MRSVPLILVAALVAVAAGAQEAPKPKEAPHVAKGTKLWAAVSVSDTILNWDDTAWEVGLRPPFGITFYLVNDGDKVVDPKVDSSQLFINGKECKGKDAPYGLDWPFIIANGPHDERRNALPPGEDHQFGYTMGKYFKEPGIYRIKWKGEGFEASEVVFRVMPRKQPDRPANATNIDRDTAGSTALEIVTTTTDPEAKWRAVRILGALRYEPAVPVLVRSLDDKHRYVRANAARALGDMKVKAAAKPLIELLRKETDGGVIQQTSLALWLIGANEAVPALKEAARHKDSQTRVWVIQAIGMLGDRKDVPFLAKYLDDPDAGVQSQAAESLQKLTGVYFGFPLPSGPTDLDPPIQWAKKWWEKNKKDYPDR
jgi:hypothetical protein